MAVSAHSAWIPSREWATLDRRNPVAIASQRPIVGGHSTNPGAIAMPNPRPTPSSLVVSVLLALVFASPPAGAQAPRPGPGQVPPGPGQVPPGPGQVPPGPAQRGPAQAQQPAPPRPYRAIPMTLPQPASDPSFVAFRKQLADIANRMDRAALARIVVANNFRPPDLIDFAMTPNRRSTAVLCRETAFRWR
jgi:hypothetical protein